MLKRIKEYREYKKNKKVIEQELIAIATTTLSVAKEFADKKADTFNFFFKLVDSTKEVSGESFIAIILNELTDKLAVEQGRLIEVLSYMADLSPDDIGTILAHSIAATMDTDTKTEKSDR